MKKNDNTYEIKKKVKEMSMKLNKGEWSEFYTFLKILSDGVIPCGSSTLQLLDDKNLNVLKAVLKNHQNGKIEYSISVDHIDVANLGNIPVTDIIVLQKILLEKIKKSKSTFTVEEVCARFTSFGTPKLKGVSGAKSDLMLKARFNDEIEVFESGFSIKSLLGGNSTLINASKQTNFIFRVEGLSDKQMSGANKLDVSETVEYII